MFLATNISKKTKGLERMKHHSDISLFMVPRYCIRRDIANTNLAKNSAILRQEQDARAARVNAPLTHEEKSARLCVIIGAIV